MTTDAAGARRRREWLSFFQQSGWMVVATGLAGVCFALVHIPAGKMGGTGNKAEWSLFATMLDTLNLLAIPAAGLQALFAQMRAAAVTEIRRAEVRQATRQAFLALAGLWLLLALVVFLAQNQVLALLKIRDAAVLWFTLLVGLLGWWVPLFAGLLQGAQRFFWLGTSQILSAAGRLGGITVVVVAFAGLAAGAMGGVLMGVATQLALVIWASRGEWQGSVTPVDWRPWIGGLIGLTLGMAPSAMMLACDSLLVQSVFGPEGKELYLAAGRIGRGLVTLTTPVAIVLFPKVARSAATGETTEALRLALGATLAVGVAAALGCTLFPGLTLQVLFGGNPAFAGAAELVPWFAWCMLPLTGAYTLINSLLARRRWSVVPWLLAVALGYAGTLAWMGQGLDRLPMPEAFRRVIATLGVFSLLLLCVALVFSLRRPAAAPAAPPA